MSDYQRPLTFLRPPKRRQAQVTYFLSAVLVLATVENSFAQQGLPGNQSTFRVPAQAPVVEASRRTAADNFVGRWSMAKPTNGWHSATITKNADGSLLWTNDAQRSWKITPDYAAMVMRTGQDCPYPGVDFKISLSQGVFTSLVFNGKMYFPQPKEERKSLPAQPALSGMGNNRAIANPRSNIASLKLSRKPGSYFGNAEVPTDLLAFQSSLLLVANEGRRDPLFRQKRNSAYFYDLSGERAIPKHPQDPRDAPRLIKQSATPPYFPDLILNPSLNAAAQFQAEFMASQKKMKHDGPANFMGQDMSNQAKRRSYFGYPYRVNENVAYFDQPVKALEGMMAANTDHFRMFFNADFDTIEIGFGAAKAPKGLWYYCVLGGEGR